MGVDAMRTSVRIRRFLGISILKCYKLVYKHPFLVGLVCFLVFLYRSFPFLFSLLVSASPVLFCTAVLLGTLLSFGEPNIPEIEKEEEEEEVAREISSLKRGVAGDSTIVFEKDEDIFVERFIGKGKDTTEEGIGEENGISKIRRDRDLGGFRQLNDGGSQEIQLEKYVTEVEREFDASELVKEREIHEKKQGIEEVLSNGNAVERLEVEDPTSTVKFIQTHTGCHLDSPNLSWRRSNDDDEEEEDEDEQASDSGSDGAESSSPDASMADIIPMLDELHPLLNVEAPQQVNVSDDGTDAGSEESHKADGEDGDDDDDHEDQEEGVQGGKDDDSKSAIKWTEDDQKNLMDLGTSELERNQRLESLIARRRARHSMKLMAEKNLIDLDGADSPVNIPPITTARRNPFDPAFDAYDDVPGSAPSVLLPGRNPFDLPYDSNEEKPDLKGDSFEHEFSQFQHREAAFRRHESFHVGPSVLGVPKQGRDLRWKPYFVPERFGTEETSYHTFQRQLSEASESKMSSVPDSESISSALEDKLNEEDVIQETDTISNVDHASVLVERGSLSSEDVDALDVEHEGRNFDHGGAEIALGDGENHHEDSSLSTSGVETPVGVNTSEILLRMEPGEDEYSSRSSISSLSEIDERISDVKNGLVHPEPSNGEIEESQISTQTSLDSDFQFINEVADENQHRKPVLELSGNHTEKLDSDFHFTTRGVYDSQHKEPVYDSSPQPAEKLIPFLSVSSDIQHGTPEIGLPPVHTNYAGKESDVKSESLEEDASPYRETHEHFTEECSQDENESRSRETRDIEHDVVVGRLSEDDRTGDGQNGKDVFMTPKSGVEHDAVDLPLSLSIEGSVNEDLIFKERSSNHDADQLDLLRLNGEITAEPHHDIIEKLDSASCSNRGASEETILHALEEQLPVHTSVDSQLSSSESETVKEHAIGVEGILQLERNQVPSSTVDADVHVNSQQALGDHEKCLVRYEPSISNNETSQPTSVPPESLEYKSQVDDVDFKDSILDKIVYEDSSHFLERPTYSVETDGPPVAGENSNEDGDVIKEIDEGLLSELDTVGDFSVKEAVGESLNGEQMQTSEDGLLLRDLSVKSVTFPSQVGTQPVDESRGIGKTNLDLQVVDARPLEDTNVVTEQASEKNIEKMPKLSDLGRGEGNEVSSSSSTRELPVLEIRTTNDIDMVFKQLSEGADVEEVIVPSTIEQHPIANESGGPQQNSSDMEVLEARSFEDLQVAMKQVSEDHFKEVLKSSDPNKDTGSITSEVTERAPNKDGEPSTSEATEVIFTKFTVVATEEGLIQKTDSKSEESGDEEANKEAPPEPKLGLLKYFGF